MSYSFTSTAYDSFISRNNWDLPYMGRDLLEEYASLEAWIESDIYLLSIKDRIMALVEGEEPVITGYNNLWTWKEDKKKYDWVSSPFWGIRIISSVPLEEFIEILKFELSFSEVTNSIRKERFSEDMLPYLEGEGVEGTWLHVLNDRLEFNRFKEYIENFLSIEGEICVSPFYERNPYKIRKRSVAVILRGKCSFLWNRDVGSEVVGNKRIPQQVYSERGEGWLVPYEAQFMGFVVEDDDLRYQLRQAGWKGIIHKFPGKVYHPDISNDVW